MQPRVALRWLERVLLVAGLLLIGLWLENDISARTFRSTESGKLDQARLGAKLARPADGRPPVKAGPPGRLESGVFGRLEIPRLGISALIAEGTGPRQLARAVGHVSTSAFPGQPGNCALAGHRDSFLRGLGEVRENDVIRIDTLEGTCTYEVQWGKVVKPRRVDVLDPTDTPSLTLVTCYPFHAVGPAPDRFVVRARLVEPVAWTSP